MGNWIENTITAKNIDTLDIFTDKQLDFNKLIPEPTSKEDCLDEFRLDIHSKDSVMPNKKTWFNWYDWRNKFWNTNINADETTIIKKDHQIHFYTQWCCPFPIVAAISRLLKNTEVSIIFQDIDDNFQPINKCVYVNGEMTHAYQSYYDYEKDEYDLNNWHEIDKPKA